MAVWSVAAETPGVVEPDPSALVEAVASGAITFWHAAALAGLASSPARGRQLRADAEHLRNAS